MSSFKGIVWAEIKALKPDFVTKKPHFNFISAHYFWVMGCTIVGSVLLYAPAAGNIKYIDALTFAAGGSTQAGLNTLDVNQLKTFQQVILYFLASLTNPITINSFVVMLRLYWFEKRFQHVVREARLRRRTLSKAKTFQATDDVSRAERGVRGRHITVVRSSHKNRVANDGTFLGSMQSVATDSAIPTQRTNGTANHGNANGSAAAAATDDDGIVDAKTPTTEPTDGRRQGIKFAQAVKRSDGVDDTINLPPRLTDEEHIAILERQRNRDDEVLRIPGPRDAERGILPRRVVEGEDENEPLSPRLRKFSTNNSTGSARSTPLPGSTLRGSGNDNDVAVEDDEEEHNRVPVRQAITIQEPVKPSRREELNEDAQAMVNVFTALGLRMPRMPRIAWHRKEKQDGDRPDRHNPLQRTMSRRILTMNNLRTAFSRDREDAPYLSWEPTIGRNSAFVGLSEEQREELGGIEYRSLKTLALVLFVYFWGFSVLGVICLLPWILRSHRYGPIVDAAGQSKVWWGIFTPHSAFMDLGFTLTPDSMNSFNTAVFPLLLLSFLIVIGNTGFPVMLRFMIWLFSLVVPPGRGLYEELKFLLDHPRRCFTLLFPSGATWWLFWLLVILNGLDLLFFIVLDLGNGPIFELPAGIRVLDGLFQAFATRTAGFSCVNLSSVHPAVQASYMIMMYISVFPIAISVRRTNVYEEKSLGIYSAPEDDEPTSGTELEYVGAHLRRQLSFDLWFMSIGFFILTISEGKRLQSDDISMFAVLFEIVSAYGTVGLSLGYPTVNASLCSQFTVVGKLVIIAMMIRGRHRGLPYGLDRAILLPSESLNAKEAADADARGPMIGRSATRRASVTSQSTQGRGQSAGPSQNTGTPMFRSATTMKEHRRSRSIDRVNSNIFTSFLHPGPTVNYSNPPPLRRAYTDTVYEENSAQASGVDLSNQDRQA